MLSHDLLKNPLTDRFSIFQRYVTLHLSTNRLKNCIGVRLFVPLFKKT